MHNKQLSHTFLLTTLLFVSAAPAADIDWDGGGDFDNWGDNKNWTMDTLPGSSDDVTVGVSVDSFLDTDFLIGDLSLQLGGKVHTNGFQLAAGDIDIGISSLLNVGPPSGSLSLKTSGIAVNNIGTMIMEEALVQMGGDLDVNIGGTLSGYGVVDFVQSVSGTQTVFLNTGSVSTRRAPGANATNHYSLVLTAADTGARADLDGIGAAGAVHILENTTLDVQMAQRHFGGWMFLAAESTFHSAHDWTINGTSVFEVNAATPNPSLTPAATISGGHLNMLGADRFNVNSGTLVFDADLDSSFSTELHLANGTGVQFNGIANYNGQLFFGNQPTLVVDSGVTTLTDASWDWDGADNNGITVVRAGGQLHINSAQISAAGDNTYRGTIGLEGNAASGSLLTVSNPVAEWTLVGQLNSTGPAQINQVLGSGNMIVDGGNVTVNTGTLQLTTGVEFTFAGSTTVNAAGTLNFAVRDVIFQGGSSHSGSGNLAFLGSDVLVAGNQIIDMPGGTVTLDGNRTNPSSSESFTLLADLTVNASSLGSAGSSFGTTTPDVIETLPNTTLTVNLTDPNDAWTLGSMGTFRVLPGTPGTSLAGSDLVVEGQVIVEETTAFDNRLDISGTIDIQNANATLNLNGGAFSPHMLLGGTINGPGRIGASPTFRRLHGHGTINADIDGLLASASGGTMVINGTVLAGRIGASDTGTLHLANAYGTGASGDVVMTGGTLTGAAIWNDAEISGWGTLKSLTITNNGQIDPFGSGALVIDTFNPSDLDGTNEIGTLLVDSTDLIVVSAMTDGFSGSMNVAAGRSAEFVQPWELASDGVLTLAGTIKGLGLMHVSGSISANDGARIESEATFAPTSSIAVSGLDSLTLAEYAVVEPGATFSGAGDLYNAGLLDLEVGTTIGTRLINQGELRITNGQGAVSFVDELFLDTPGEVRVQIGGTTVGEFDNVSVAQELALGGDLDVDLVNGFLPQQDETFAILSTSNMGTILGDFDSFDFPALPGNLGWEIDRSDPLVYVLRVVQSMITGDFDGNGDFACNDIDMLVAEIVAGTNNSAFDLTGDGQVNSADLDAWLAEAGAAELASGNPYLPGDANLDGFVNGADFVEWNNHKFTSTAAWCDADFNADGFVNGQDFVIWNNHKFSSADAAPFAVPAPITSPLVAFVLISAVARSRCRRFSPGFRRGLLINPVGQSLRY